jgi:hypothetical protein
MAKTAAMAEKIKLSQSLDAMVLLLIFDGGASTNQDHSTTRVCTLRLRAAH